MRDPAGGHNTLGGKGACPHRTGHMIRSIVTQSSRSAAVHIPSDCSPYPYLPNIPPPHTFSLWLLPPCVDSLIFAQFYDTFLRSFPCITLCDLAPDWMTRCDCSVQLTVASSHNYGSVYSTVIAQYICKIQSLGALNPHAPHR
jgi:hypothetical protein